MLLVAADCCTSCSMALSVSFLSVLPAQQAKAQRWAVEQLWEEWRCSIRSFALQTDRQTDGELVVSDDRVSVSVCGKGDVDGLFCTLLQPLYCRRLQWSRRVTLFGVYRLQQFFCFSTVSLSVWVWVLYCMNMLLLLVSASAPQRGALSVKKREQSSWQVPKWHRHLECCCCRRLVK